MAKLRYAHIINEDQRYKRLADLSLGIEDLDTSKLMPRLTQLVDPDHLPLLAESRSLIDEDGYGLATDDPARRRLIKQAIKLHRKKGTPYAIKLFLKALDMGEVRLHEGGRHKQHDAVIKYRDGFHLRGSANKWAYFQIEFLTEPVQKSKLDEIVWGVRSYAPARCILSGLKQAVGALRHNKRITRNGQHYRGQIWLT